MNRKHPICLVSMPDRRFPGATEFYLHIDTELTEFYVAVGRQGLDGEAIGYLKFVRVAEEEFSSGVLAGNFELQAMLPASSSVPSPILSLSGVLWRRQEAVLAHQRISAFQVGLEGMP